MCAHRDDHAIHVDVHEMADCGERQDRRAVEHALKWLSLQRLRCCLSSSKYHLPKNVRLTVPKHVVHVPGAKVVTSLPSYIFNTIC